MYYVTETNSSSFETWELCSLLYDPHSLYSDWISAEGENNIIRAELGRRGVQTKGDCSVESQAKTKCDGYGFTAGTVEHAKCRVDVEQHIEKMKQMKKAAHEAGQNAAAIQAQGISNNIQLQMLQQQQQWQLNQTPWYLTPGL